MKQLINWQKNLPLVSGRFANPFFSLQNDIEKAISEFYNIFDIQPSSPSTDIEKLIINPSIDIIEDEQSYKAVVEMPGIDEKNIKVNINNGILSIQSKKEISKKDEGKNYISREISYGTYDRKISLPDYVDTENAKASFKKGMLWVTFPKKVDSGAQQLEIKVEKAE